MNVTAYKSQPEFKSLVFSQLFQGHGECVIVDSAVYRKGECFCSEGWQVNSKHVVTHNYQWWSSLPAVLAIAIECLWHQTKWQWQYQGNNCELENNWDGNATSFDRADFQVKQCPCMTWVGAFKQHIGGEAGRWCWAAVEEIWRWGERENSTRQAASQVLQPPSSWKASEVGNLTCKLQADAHPKCHVMKLHTEV